MTRKSISGDNNPMKRPEVRAKHKEAINRPEVLAKMSKARKGKPLSLQHRIRISESHKKLGDNHWCKRPEVRAKLSGERSPTKRPEVRKKISEALKGQTGERSHNWKGGVSFEPYCPKFTKEFKERVRAFWNYQCGNCGKSQVENGTALSVHHVHYLKTACCDDKVPRYFIPLCKSCHGKTNKGHEYWQKVLSQKIDNKFDGKCYFHRNEVLTTWGVKV